LVAVVAVAALVLGACVTVNVYFPAAEVKDLSRKIEDEVQKEAAKAQDKPAAPAQEPKAPADPNAPDGRNAPATVPPSAPGSASLFDTLLGVTPAYAQGVADPEVTSPAIRKIIESRAARVASLDKYKSAGVIGENNKALLEIRSLDAVTDLKSRAEAQRLVKDENADRTELFAEIAATKKVDATQIPKIQETYAQTIRERARAGDWIQMPDGAWKQK
jgi:uncharacterized protein YdbL (DUF1318 family)